MPKQRKTEAVIPEAPSVWSPLLQELGSLDGSQDLVNLLQHVLKLLQRVSPQDAAGIFLLDEETRTIQGQVTDLFDRDLTAGAGSLQAVLRNPAAFVISHLEAPAAPTKRPAVFGAQIVIPLRASPQVRGALILRSSRPSAFRERDGRVLSQFGLRVSAAIENALIQQRMLRVGDQEAGRDMVMAQQIMARLLPQKPPHIPGFQVASFYLPAKVVGGDLLDFITMPDDHHGFLVADASGDGTPAALLMTGFRALFRGLILNDFTIRSVFRKANRQLFASTASHQFVSAFYASLDATTGRVIYVNGGHVPPLLYRPGQPPRRLDIGGPVLGVLAEASYHEDSIVLRSRDILVCYSDGLSEAENAAGEAFDESRILGVVEECQEQSAEAICGALREAAVQFVNFNFRDDLTICVLKYL